MSEEIKFQISIYCYLVKTGKPTVMIPIQDRYINEALKIINKESLIAYIQDLSEGWKTLWIYKDKYLLEIIKNMPEKPKTAYEHWVLGKIFGYSDEAIREFIETKLFDTQFCGI